MDSPNVTDHGSRDRRDEKRQRAVGAIESGRAATVVASDTGRKRRGSPYPPCPTLQCSCSMPPQPREESTAAADAAKHSTLEKKIPGRGQRLFTGRGASGSAAWNS